MRVFKSFFVLPLLVAVVFLTTSCEEKGGRKSSATPPPQATAPTLTKTEAPSPTPEPAQKSESKPAAPQQQDEAAALIERVEREYQKGQANYSAGHLEAAKDDFDRAFNMLLRGKVGIHDDDRLESEFDKIVDSINKLEMLALKQGDGFSEQKSEPAPIDEANEVTFPVDPNVRAKAEEEVRMTKSDLPLMMNDQVASFISYFSNRGRGTLERALTRSGRYRDMISRIFKEEGVPQDLIYLAQAESGFHPLALSRAGARGMWQFMASRASGYGLERNWWVDDRQDPEKSTRAAAKHLKDLYNQFGDWYLAMAAYNSGPGTVQRAVQRTGYADFWELYRRGVLPKETKNYVPIIVAVTIMAKNPAQYGLESVVPETPPQVDRVKVDYPLDLRLAAECADTSVATLQELNPSLLRMTTPKDQEFELILPAGSKDKFETAIAGIPADKRTYWRYHKVEPGETLSEIASRYRTPSKAIAEVNNIEVESDLQADSKLIIPVTPGRGGEKVVYSKRPTRYKVRRGDTVVSVADDFGVPVERLRRWNRLRGNALRTGRTLVIYRPVSGGSEPASAGSSKKVSRSAKIKAVVADEAEPSKTKKTKTNSTVRKHKVKSGETLTSIAAEYDTTVEQLKKDNHGAGKILRAGQVIVIR